MTFLACVNKYESLFFTHLLSNLEDGKKKRSEKYQSNVSFIVLILFSADRGVLQVVLPVLDNRVSSSSYTVQTKSFFLYTYFNILLFTCEVCFWKDDFLISSNSWRGENCIFWFIFILGPDAPLLRDTRCNAPQTTFKFFVLPRQQIWNWLEFSTNWKNVRMLKVAESPLYVSHLHLPLSLTWSLELASIASRLPSFWWLLLETTLRDLFWRWSYPESHPLNWYYLKNYVAAVWHWSLLSL